MIDRVEEMGLVVRRPDPGDRRATIVEITPAGREMMARARTIIDGVLASVWAEGMSDDESRIVIAVMDRVLDRHQTAG